MTTATLNLAPSSQTCVPFVELRQALGGIAHDLERDFGATLSRERIDQALAVAVFDLRTAAVTRWLPLLVYRRSREGLLAAQGKEAPMS